MLMLWTALEGWALRADFLGSTSGASFMRQVRKAADGLDAPDQGTQNSTLGPTWPSPKPLPKILSIRLISAPHDLLRT